MAGKNMKEIQLQSWVRVDAPLRKLWPLISNTDQRNKVLGIARMQQEEVPDPKGGSIKYHRLRMLGKSINILEMPINWCRYQYIEESRIFDAGPIRRLKSRIEFEDHEQHCLIRSIISVEARWVVALPMLYGLVKSSLKKLNKHYESLAQYVNGRSKIPFRTSDEVKRGSLPMEKNPLFKELSMKCNKTYPGDKELSDTLIRYLLEAPSEELKKIRPYRVAVKLGMEKREVLSWMLKGTIIGILDLHWDILCPNCRGGKNSVSTLRDLRLTVHCTSCNISYEADFDRSVEVSFTPHASVRKIDIQIFCLGSPARTLHILSQTQLEPNTSKEIVLELDEGIHRIYSPHFRKKVFLEVKLDASNLSRYYFDFDLRTEGEERIQLQPGLHSFTFGNRELSHDVVVRIERTEWLDDIVTANEISALQEFRAQFSSEVLSPGIELKVNHVTILFTDLKNSTEFYNQMGDAVAFKVVKEHFDVLQESVSLYEGAIVKTIGDAIMAVFIRPENGVAAALEIQQRIRRFNLMLPVDRRIAVKSGLHCGPALAVNLNERLDYFGHSVNLAARTNSLSRGEDVIMTEDLYRQPGVQRILNDRKLSTEYFRANLKGFTDNYLLYRIYEEQEFR